jgi:hypothetical protein
MWLERSIRESSWKAQQLRMLRAQTCRRHSEETACRRPA